jgi:protein-tyrosine phosphatase
MDCDQVLSQIVIGSYPETTADIDRLRQDLGVTAVLNVQSEEDDEYLSIPWSVLESHYRLSGIEVRRVPVIDFDQADLRRNLPECVAALRELIDDGHTVYVHCTAGIGRSPSVVIAYLHWVENLDLEEAARQVQSRRRCSPDLQAIRLAGGDWAD